jgi:GNAT acetyltransferase-like protein
MRRRRSGTCEGCRRSDRAVIDPLALPDLPRWIEAHGIAADPASWRRALGDGFAVGSDAARLVVVAGEADAAAVAALAREVPRHTMLFAIERADLAQASGRGVVRARLHTLPDDADDLAGLDGAAVLPPDVSLAHVPAPLADELAMVRAHHTIWTAFLDGVPVSFAYAPWRSPQWFDVSVDTLAGSRQLGLGRIVAAAMIRDERARGRAPVWGADEDNAASLRLARSLGFVAVDALWVAA